MTAPAFAKGDKGDTGSQGEIGNTGLQGEIGNTGLQGETGYTGSQGKIGEKGEKGDRGKPGQNWFRSWFSNREPFITFIFFIALSVLSFGSIVSARQTNNYIKQQSNGNKANVSCLVGILTTTPVQDWPTSRDLIITTYSACVEAGSK